MAGGDSVSIWALVDWDDPLPGFFRDRLEQGLPATVGVRVELWRDRSGWFDANLIASATELKVVPDPWNSGYSVLGPGEPVGPIIGPLPERSTTHVSTLEDLTDLLSRNRLRIPVETGWCDGTSTYEVVGVTYVRPLTAGDVGEVEGWLRGGVEEIPGGLLGMPRGLFGIVRDLAGLGERAYRGKSRRFRISLLPSLRTRVLIPSGAEAGTVVPSAGSR